MVVDILKSSSSAPPPGDPVRVARRETWERADLTRAGRRRESIERRWRLPSGTAPRFLAPSSDHPIHSAGGRRAAGRMTGGRLPPPLGPHRGQKAGQISCLAPPPGRRGFLHPHRYITDRRGTCYPGRFGRRVTIRGPPAMASGTDPEGETFWRAPGPGLVWARRPGSQAPLRARHRSRSDPDHFMHRIVLQLFR